MPEADAAPRSERQMVLDMLAAGQVTVEEAERLLEALGQSSARRDNRETGSDGDDETFGFRIPIPGFDMPIDLEFPRNLGIDDDAIADMREAMADLKEQLADLHDRRRDLAHEIRDRVREVRDRMWDERGPREPREPREPVRARDPRPPREPREPRPPRPPRPPRVPDVPDLPLPPDPPDPPAPPDV